MSKEIPWTFVSWLKNFENVDLPIGDFAKDICNDEDFPTEDYSTEILEYLSSKNISEDQMLEFLSIWDFYISSNSMPESRAAFLRNVSK